MQTTRLSSKTKNVLAVLGKWRFWLSVAQRFQDRQGSDAVAILAYTSLIGIVPMLAVMLSLFSVSTYFADFESLVMEQVVHNLIPSSQPMIEGYLFKFSQQAVHLTTPGLIVMFLTTLLLLWKVDEKLNAMWSERLNRKWWVSLLHYLGVSLLGPLLLGLSLVTSSYILAQPLLAETTPWISQLTFGIGLLPILLSWLGFTFLFKFVPVAFVPANIAFLAGLFATLQLELLKYGFTIYVKLFPTYDLIYGAFAAIPLFLLWLYLIWLIVIWNGAFVASLVKVFKPESLTASDNSLLLAEDKAEVTAEGKTE
ncbi:MAG: membrane protein [Thiomicrorhabdus sp.]|nr:MAG: membrane protein [Thiomicrorhabdus sp.]